MAKMTLRVGSDATKEHVTLQLEEEGKSIGHINFDPPTVDKHIRDVARVRMELTDPVPATLDEGARVEAIFNPAWRVSPGPAPETVALTLRHPGLGWVSVLLPAAEARGMAGWLAGLGQTQKPIAD